MKESSSSDLSPEIMQSAGVVPDGFLAKNRWMTFLLPFLGFLVVTSLEPRPDQPGGADIGLAIPYSFYPLLYTLKVVLVGILIGVVWKGLMAFKCRVSFLAILVGVVGAGVWIGIWELDRIYGINEKVFGPIGLGKFVASGERSAFNPLVELADNPAWAYGFLAIRFIGLALLVPIMEEFFLRGFLMRFVQDKDWWKIPFGQVTPLALVVGTAVPMLMHPQEVFGALVWFSMISWLMVRTKNIWDCVAAHAVTNLLMGVYVVSTGKWGMM